MNLTSISIARVKEAEKKFDMFPATGLAAWERAAKEELQGLDPWGKLAQTVDGIEIKPYYTATTSSAKTLRLPVSKDPYLGPRAWYNCPLVSVQDPIQANTIALEHLQQGANGVLFELHDVVNFSQLLQAIEWPYCSLNFLAKENADAIAIDLDRFLDGRQGPTHGALFGNHQSLPPSNHSFCFVGLEISAQGAAIDALAEGIIAMDQLLGDAFGSRSTQTAFSVEIGTDFFMEICKLRALRGVWQYLAAKRGIQAASALFIHARSRAWTAEPFAPHGNMLKATTAAMSAILGGCDVLTIEPEYSNDATMNSAARNISNVLREESHFSKVADPLAGSYFVDELTAHLTEGVWKLVQTSMKR